MSYARSPLEVCSTTMGTRTDPILPPDYLIECGPLGPFCGDSTFGFALLSRSDSLLLLIQRLGQVQNRISPQIIHDTPSEGYPAIVHGAGHVVITLGESAGALLVRRQTVERFHDIQEANLARVHA